MDGISTLLWWWLNAGKPCFKFPENRNPRQLNYRTKICKSEAFANCSSQVEPFLSKIRDIPFTFTFQNQDDFQIPKETGLHYWAVSLHNQNNIEIAWAWNVPSLNKPETFTLICCADAKSYQSISQSIEQRKKFH